MADTAHANACAIILISIAFAFNAFNAAYYYSAYSVEAGLLIIAGCAALLIHYERMRDRNHSLKAAQGQAVYGRAVAATAFAEIIALVPDLSFQNISALYINPQLAAFACLAVIIAPLMAYAIRISSSRINAVTKDPFSYLYLGSILFGLLGLYSLALYSGSAYLNAQAFISTVLFMNEGMLFALISMSLLFA